jgi:3-deoxy-D-manno-octulosonate 8-phosphate phosphatase KdsC-like HAD superfamily phosphatase
MKSVGFPLCPSDAAMEIKKISRYQLPVKGGEGVVRVLLRYLFINSEYSKFI